MAFCYTCAAEIYLHAGSFSLMNKMSENLKRKINEAPLNRPPNVQLIIRKKLTFIEYRIIKIFVFILKNVPTL